MDSLRIGLLGLGFMGSTHLKAMRKVAGVELAAVMSNDERQLSGDLTGTQGNFGGPGEMLDFSGIGKYRDIDSLLADKSIDAVDICLPTNMHETAAITALRAGKHVLVEKPMALDGAAADRMAAEGERQERVLMSAQVLRFLPQYEALRDAVASRRYGAPRVAMFRRRCAAPAWGGWLNNPAISGGGAFDLLIHDIDMCVHLFGVPDAVSATGYQDAAAGIDTVDATLYYADGLTAVVTGGWFLAGKFPFSMEFAVTLDGATIDFSSAGRPYTVYPLKEEAQVVDASEGDGYAGEIGYFAQCCREGVAPKLCPPRESAQSVKLTRAVLEARDRKGEKIACRI